MKILLICSIIVEALLLVFYVYSPLVRSGAKNLAAKMSCAVMYVVIGFLAAEASGGYNAYAALITTGAIFGALGDLTLNMDVNSNRFFVGLGSFLTGHIFYSASFGLMIGKITELTPLKIFLTAAAAIVLSSILVAAGRKHGLLPKKFFRPILLYVFSITAMLGFSLSLAIAIGSVRNIGAAVCVAAGAVMFVVSDAVLALRTFARDRFSINRFVNPLTYFPAQVLIGLSIYFVNLVNHA